MHQTHEHIERFLLVLDERVFLAPGAVVDAFAELIEIVQVIFPFLVDHAQSHVRQRLLGEVRGADLGFDIAEIAELLLEGFTTHLLGRTHQLFTIPHYRGIADARN